MVERECRVVYRVLCRVEWAYRESAKRIGEGVYRL